MPGATLDDVIAFVRDQEGVRRRRAITAETRLGADLGVTGYDGVDLLEAAERRFGVSLLSEEHGVCEAFGLGPDEVLFGSEGFDLLGLLLGRPEPNVRDLTVAELHRAIVSATPR